MPCAREGTLTDEHSSVELLVLARSGDRDALDRLMRRYLVPLRRWTHGRLPRWARDLADTEDLVQETMAQTLKHVMTLPLADQASLHAYLREAVLNRIRNELRRVSRKPRPSPLDSNVPASAESPLERAITAEALHRYEAALAQLSPSDREAIVGRFELGFSFAELAQALKKPSSDAARMAVSRATRRLTRLLVASPRS
jgi:RNA polymerase sigma-70 factor (ECF subfamily)